MTIGIIGARAIGRKVKSTKNHSAVRGGDLVCLVYLVRLVYLVCLVR